MKSRSSVPTHRHEPTVSGITARLAAVEDVHPGGSLWITMHWLADGFLSQRSLRATLPSRVVTAAHRCLRCRTGVPVGDPQPERHADGPGVPGSARGPMPSSTACA